jgi:Spherulation-specific family 4
MRPTLNRHARGRLPVTTPGRLIVALAAVLALAAGAVTVRLVTGSRSGCQEAFVPAYFYPGASWTQAITSKPPPGLMILDVTSSGAGGSPDRNYQAAVKRAQGAGITIMGYSSTDYTRRPAVAVEADVSHYRSWYHVTDIFLDEASSDGSGAAYYQRLVSYIHGASPGSKVMLNPGTYPDQRYMSIGDIIMVYENTYASYVRLRVPGWARHYPAAKFAHAIYATSGSELASAISLSRQRNAGYLYVTGNSGANPYSSLPAYWPGENAIIARCARVAASPAGGPGPRPGGAGAGAGAGAG